MSDTQTSNPEQVLAQLSEMVCEVGFDHRFRYLNPAWMPMLGFSPSELYNRPVEDMIHPEDRPVIAAAFDRLSREATARSFEVRGIDADFK